MTLLARVAGAVARPRPTAAPRNRASAAAALLACLLLPAAAAAHGEPAALAFWGDFGLPLARCQREIGLAGARCGLNAWRIRRDCRLAVLSGGTCDTSAANAAVEQVRRDAADRIPPVCSEPQVQQLRFLDVHEAQSDVIRFCRGLETAVVSAVFLPVPADAGTLSDAERTCIAAASQSTTKLLNVGFRSRRRTLDRIAQRSFTPARKRMLVDESTAQIAGRTGQLATEQARTCSAEAFAALYGRASEAFLATIASRADCLAGDTYAQAAVLCPPAVCGNGMREPSEDCDDGNTVAGDTCPADCVRS